MVLMGTMQEFKLKIHNLKVCIIEVNCCRYSPDAEPFEVELDHWITSQDAKHLVGDEGAKKYVQKALSCGYIGYATGGLD